MSERDDLVGPLLMSYSEALEAIAGVVRDMADHGARVALENAADWLNNHDAVDEGDAEAYERAKVRLDADECLRARLKAATELLHAVAETSVYGFVPPPTILAARAFLAAEDS